MFRNEIYSDQVNLLNIEKGVVESSIAFSSSLTITSQSPRINQNMKSEYDNVTLSELEHEDSTVTILTTFNCTGLQVAP